MEVVEFIGFFVAMFFLIVSSILRGRERREREKNPEKYAEKEKTREEALRRFLQVMDVDPEALEEERKATPPPPPNVKKKSPPSPPKKTREVRRPADERYALKSRIEDRKRESRVESKHLSLHISEDHGSDLVHISPHEAPGSEAYVRPHSDIYDRPKPKAYDLDTGAYAVEKRAHASRIRAELQKLDSYRTAILIGEVLGPPKSLQ